MLLKLFAAAFIVYSEIDYDESTLVVDCKDLIKFFLKYKNKENEGIIEAARIGNLQITRMFHCILCHRYRLPLEELRRATKTAARYGYIEIVKYLKPRDQWEIKDVIIAAARGGHKEIVQMMLMKEEPGFWYDVYTKLALEYGAIGGHKEIIQWLIDLGINDYNLCLIGAACGGERSSQDIMEWMIELGANNYSDAARAAANYGHIEIVKWMISLGANNYNAIMANAAKGGIFPVDFLTDADSQPYHKEIIQWMIDLGANDYNWTMYFAALRGNKEIIQWMINLGANDYNHTMQFAAMGGKYYIGTPDEQRHLDIVKWMLDLGADEYDICIGVGIEKINKLIETYRKN